VPPRKQSLDEAAGLQLLDEAGQERDGVRPLAPGHADRLLDLHEGAVEQPQAGPGRDELGEWLADPRGHFQAAIGERRRPVGTAHHRGVPQRAGQVQVVGRPLLDPDPHARGVDGGDRGQRRVARDGEDALDDHVRRREDDLGRPGRVDGQETDIGPA
jgi:hypothetical protein